MRATAGVAGRLLLLFLLGGAVLSLLALRDLTFDHTTRSLMRSDPEADAREKELARVFGGEDILLLAWEAATPPGPATFRRIQRITAGLQKIDGLDRVYSLSTVPLGIGGSVRRLREADFAAGAARTKTWAALRLATVYTATLYSPSLDVMAVASSFRHASRSQREETLAAVRAVANREPGTYVSGVTPFAVAAARYAIRDLVRIGLAALAIAVAVLLLLCGSLRETLIAVLATGLPPLYALGLAARFALPITALGAALFPVMAVVGITSSVHLLNGYAEERRRTADAGLAAGRAARRLAAPILLSLLTTAAAFWSLQVTGVPAFHAAGLVVASGLLTAIPVVLLGIPAALALVAPAPRLGHTPRLDRLLLVLAIFVRRQRRAILIVSLGLALLGAWMLPRSRLQVQVLQAFQPGSEIARTYRFLERRLTATVPIDLILQARSASSDHAVLADLRRFSRAAERIEGVQSALGLDDLVAYGQAIAPVGERSALLFLRSMLREETNRFEDAEGRRYRVKIRVREGTPPVVLDSLRALTRDFRSGTAQLTGLFERAVGTTRHLIGDLVRGSLLMTLVVVTTVAIALKSLRTGLAALLPNLLPPLVVFGIAAAARIPLDISAVAVGAVSIGLAVDDSLHLLFRLHAERRRRGPESALIRTQRSVGRALVLSTFVLAAGLICLLASSFLPTARFGLYTSASSGVALLADLLLLPALLRVMKCL